MSKRLWVGTSGTVVCDEHAGVYLKSSIEANPTSATHETPLDWWVLYTTKTFPCETCVPWNVRGKKVGA